MADVVEGEVAEDLPLGETLLGWCQDGLHIECPGTIWPVQHPDPARKGATYTLPGRRCPCACHTRPATMTPGATKGSR